MKRRTCEYYLNQGLYFTDCNAKFTARPMGSCDHCGKKPKEKDAEDVRRIKFDTRKR